MGGVGIGVAEAVGQVLLLVEARQAGPGVREGLIQRGSRDLFMAASSWVRIPDGMLVVWMVMVGLLTLSISMAWAAVRRLEIARAVNPVRAWVILLPERL